MVSFAINFHFKKKKTLNVVVILPMPPPKHVLLIYFKYVVTCTQAINEANILGVPYSNYYDENEFLILIFLYGEFCPILVSFLDEKFPNSKKAQLWVFFCPNLWHSWMSFFFWWRKTQFPFFKLCIFIFLFGENHLVIKKILLNIPFLSKTSCQKWKLEMKKKTIMFLHIVQASKPGYKRI